MPGAKKTIDKIRAKHRFFQLLQPVNAGEYFMSQKKVERRKELDRKRHRRAERLKARIREAKAAKKS